MPDRLSALDASFLYLEDSATPMHVGEVAIFKRTDDHFSFDQFRHLIEQRLTYLPRYRQRIATIPGHLARPVWIDDVDFDLDYHVRRSALPAPGNEEQLFELAARLMSRRLAPERPLWEAYFIEGLTNNQVAVIIKTHQSAVDGIGTIDLAQLILEPKPQSTVKSEVDSLPWAPRTPPTGAELLIGAAKEAVRQPTEIVENLRSTVSDFSATMKKLTGFASDIAGTVGNLTKPIPSSPLNVTVSSGRTLATIRSPLAKYRNIKTAYGGTINDAVLAVITGGLREWLLSRGADLSATTSIRALVPMAVRDDETLEYGGAGLTGNHVAAYLVDLPVGEVNQVLRLHHISHATRAHLDSGKSVTARALLKAGGFAPATLHSLGARAASSFSDRFFNLVITNSPGPQEPLYALSAELKEMYPVMPLVRNQALAIGVTSYNGSVYCGLNGDRKAMSDIGVLADMIEVSLHELADAALDHLHARKNKGANE